MTEVTVLRDKYAKGWPRHEHGEAGYVMDLGRALELSYRTDAHFTAYKTPNARRLVVEAIEALGAIELTTTVFDVDCPEVHGTPAPVPDAWRADLRAKVRALSAAHPGAYFYETKGGARIVYAQAEPTVLRTQADAIGWRQEYAIAVAHLADAFGIIADPACADWQRHYRLPHATREAGGKPENRPTLGDPRQIGSLTIDPSAASIVAAKSQSKAFKTRRVLKFVPGSDGGDGLLYHLLRAQNSLVRQHGREAFVIRCPFERQHSTGSTGDGSTLLYLPAAGHQIGAVHCLHGHCAGRTVRDWLGAFSETEIVEARRAAGIQVA